MTTEAVIMLNVKNNTIKIASFFIFIPLSVCWSFKEKFFLPPFAKGFRYNEKKKKSTKIYRELEFRHWTSDFRHQTFQVRLDKT
jgi:hypothetical protein